MGVQTLICFYCRSPIKENGQPAEHVKVFNEPAYNACLKCLQKKADARRLQDDEDDD